ncbi:MAG TPA: YcbK family protein [Steroidobacteraceae bacterium]|jgi:uncharacterized protein YcbK (DUF882 family)|nr:YcbK family protein [Steroidobacteraceae bacterium]
MISRRRLLAAGTLVGVSAACPCSLMAASGSAGRQIGLNNLHTGERLDIEYFRNGAYLPDAMAAIAKLLRDFRDGEQHAIDPKLMDYLSDVAAQAGKPPSYSVISGYRSAETNERLHERSNGVSQHSLHMQGRAIDVRMEGVDCKDLAARAESLRRGGVGYYRASNFVHLDTGAFRTWRG